jgi:hypothetical protein
MGLYSHYDGAHNHPVNRALHMIAIPVGFSSLIVVWYHWIIALLLIPFAFALAWLGHLISAIRRMFSWLRSGWRARFSAAARRRPRRPISQTIRSVGR